MLSPSKTLLIYIYATNDKYSLQYHIQRALCSLSYVYILSGTITGLCFLNTYHGNYTDHVITNTIHGLIVLSALARLLHYSYYCHCKHVYNYQYQYYYRLCFTKAIYHGHTTLAYIVDTVTRRCTSTDRLLEYFEGCVNHLCPVSLSFFIFI